MSGWVSGTAAMIRPVDPKTVAVYEERAQEYRTRRPARHPDWAAALAAVALDGLPRVDLGCGPGSYTGMLGAPVVALDAARAMLDLVPDAAPGALRVQADLEALPFRTAGLGGAFARASYLHVPRPRLPLALAALHRSLRLGAPFHGSMRAGTADGLLAEDDLPGRCFAAWELDAFADVLVGAGFTVDELTHHGDEWLRFRATRAHTLPDTVGPGMRLLVCGLNPSVYSADAGIGFARPGNRYWPAATAAGLVTRPRDTVHALVGHGVGMTDIVKRATPRADALTVDEYRTGLARVSRLAAWLRPGAICFVGLAGYRAALDRRAGAGWQDASLGGVPVYVMPSTSGLNAHAQLPVLVEHLRAAMAGP
jgi:TDG/mug DNA glycosylase family protein